MGTSTRFEITSIDALGTPLPDYSVYVGACYLGTLSIGDSCEYYYWSKPVPRCFGAWFLLDVGNKLNELNSKIDYDIT